jgi:hypothetical protein
MVADVAAITLAPHQPGLEQNAEIGRHGVLADIEAFADLARGHAFGTGGYEQPENGEAGFLAEGRKGVQCGLLIHVRWVVDSAGLRKLGHVARRSVSGFPRRHE